MPNSHPTPAEAEHNPHVHHEESDVNIRSIFEFGVGLAVIGALIHLLVWVLFVYFNGREARATPEPPLAVGQESRLPPGPRLQVAPRQDLQDFRAREDEILNNYEWIDKNAGRVRIPIDVAMKLTVQRGLPVRSQPEKSVENK